MNFEIVSYILGSTCLVLGGFILKLVRYGSDLERQVSEWEDKYLSLDLSHNRLLNTCRDTHNDREKLRLPVYKLSGVSTTNTLCKQKRGRPKRSKNKKSNKPKK